MSTLSQAQSDHDTTNKQGFFVQIRESIITGIRHLYIKKGLLNRTDPDVYIGIKMINYRSEKKTGRTTKIPIRKLSERMGFESTTPIKQSIKRLIHVGLIVPDKQKERRAASYKVNEDKEKEIAEKVMNDPYLRSLLEFNERQKTLKSGTRKSPD